MENRREEYKDGSAEIKLKVGTEEEEEVVVEKEQHRNRMSRRKTEVTKEDAENKKHAKSRVRMSRERKKTLFFVCEKDKKESRRG